MKFRPLSQYTALTKNEFFFLFITSAGRTCVLVFINQLLQKIGGQSYIKYFKKIEIERILVTAIMQSKL